jgi:hypothetical protein
MKDFSKKVNYSEVRGCVFLPYLEITASTHWGNKNYGKQKPLTPDRERSDQPDF